MKKILKTISSLGLTVLTIWLIYYALTSGGTFTKYFTILFGLTRIFIETFIVYKFCSKSNKKIIREIPRKLPHILVSVLVYPILFHSFAWNKMTIHFVLLPLTAFLVVLLAFNTSLTKFVERDGDKNKKGLIFYALGIVTTCTLSYIDRSFLVPAFIGMLAIGVGDCMSAFVGIAFGKHKICKGKKSIEGFLGFIFFSTIAMMIFILPITNINILKLILISTIGGIVELYSGDYDNLAIPLVVCIVGKFIL